MNPSPAQPPAQLKVAWCSYFPVEWLPEAPAEIRDLPKLHPASWQRVLWQEFARQGGLGLDVLVTRSQFRRSVTFECQGTRFHCLRTPPGMRTASLYWIDTWLIRRALRTIRPHLVHAWGTEFGGASIAGRLGYPALVTMQGILQWLGTVFPLNRTQQVARFLEKRALPRTRAATVESRFGLDYLQARYPKLKLLRIEHAPNPLFAALRRAPRTDPPRLLCIGALSHAKGADIVFPALAQLARDFNFTVSWIGARDAAFEEQMRAAAGEAIWPRISFQHNLSPEQIAEEMRTATLLIHASRADNSPNSVKEAAVAGLPAIATRTGGVPDYVTPGANGFLFESGDLAECTEMIRQALRHPLFANGQVDPATLDRVREELSAATMARKFLEAYRETLELYRAAYLAEASPKRPGR